MSTYIILKQIFLMTQIQCKDLQRRYYHYYVHNGIYYAYMLRIGSLCYTQMHRIGSLYYTYTPSHMVTALLTFFVRYDVTILMMCFHARGALVVIVRGKVTALCSSFYCKGEQAFVRLPCWTVLVSVLMRCGLSKDFEKFVPYSSVFRLIRKK